MITCIPLECVVLTNSNPVFNFLWIYPDAGGLIFECWNLQSQNTTTREPNLER